MIRPVQSILLLSKEAEELLTSPSLQITGAGGKLTPHPESVTNEGEDLPSMTHQQVKETGCLSCHVKLSSRDEQVQHYQLDWHRYNLKRKLKGLSHVDQEEFEKMAGDLSSISGSGSDSALSDHTSNDNSCSPSRTYDRHPQGSVMKSPYIHFTVGDTGLSHSVFRCIVADSHSSEAGECDLRTALRCLKNPQVWIILIRSGGHFAGAVFKGVSMVAHKTFHRYTVRAKRGTAQSIRDSQQGGHHPKSAGASLRRYNEAALEQEIRDLIGSWTEHVKEASCIFIRTPKYSRGSLIGDRGTKAPFTRGDPRLRVLPFPTRRPTLKEVQAVHKKLATIYIGLVKGDQNHREEDQPTKQRGEGEEEGLHQSGGVREDEGGDEGEMTLVIDRKEDTVVSDSEKDTKKKKKGRKKDKGLQEDKDQQLLGVPQFIRQLLAECAGSEVTSAENCRAILMETGLRPIVEQTEPQVKLECDLSKNSVPECREMEPDGHQQAELVCDHKDHLNVTWNGDTVLHTAAASGCSNLIPILMLYGCDPTIKNQYGHTPYLVSKTKDVRDSFRRFMAQYPTAYDFDSTHIPSPLTEDMERERNRKEAERKKERKKAKKQREKVRKAEKELEKTEESQRQAVASLSEREKRALAAERRMAAAQALIPSSSTSTAGVCSGCGRSLLGLVPFEKLEFKYCSMDCLKQHRKQLASK